MGGHFCLACLYAVATAFRRHSLPSLHSDSALLLVYLGAERRYPVGITVYSRLATAQQTAYFDYRRLARYCRLGIQYFHTRCAGELDSGTRAAVARNGVEPFRTVPPGTQAHGKLASLVDC